MGGRSQKSPIIRNIFRIVTKDLKKYEKEYYIPNIQGTGEWRLVIG